MFPCPECSYKFTESSNLRRHIEKCHKGRDKKRFLCAKCGNSFATNFTLKRHNSKMHSGAPPPEGSSSLLPQPSTSTSGQCPPSPPPASPSAKFKCIYCARSYTWKNDLYRHIRLSHDATESTISTMEKLDRMLPCSECGSIFTDPQSLRKHMKTVHRIMDAKTFACDECDKSFSHKSLLNRHMLSHSKKPKSVPPIASTDILQPSTSTSAQCPPRPPPPPASARRKYQCPACEKSYTWRYELNRHLNSCHVFVPEVCSYCGASFTNMQDLSDHMKTKCPAINERTATQPSISQRRTSSDGGVEDAEGFKTWTYKTMTNDSRSNMTVQQSASMDQLTDANKPLLDEILRLMGHGFQTLHERDKRIGALWYFLKRIQDAGDADSLELRDLRRMAMENLQHFLHEGINLWSSLGSNLETLQFTSETSNALVRQLLTVSRIIYKELCSDSTSLEQLENTFQNLQDDPTRCQSFLPNFFHYIIRAIQRSEALQRFLACSQGEFCRFLLEEEPTEMPGKNVPCGAEIEDITMQLECLPGPSADQMIIPSASTSTAMLPNTSQPCDDDLPDEIPPDNVAYVQSWLDEVSFNQNTDRE